MITRHKVAAGVTNDGNLQVANEFDDIFAEALLIGKCIARLIDAAVKPLTIIYDHPVGLAPELLAPDGSAGIRITSEPFSRALCERLQRPVVSTSANKSGQPSPASFSDISPEIIDGVDYVVRFKRDQKGGTASNIIKLGEAGRVKVIR